MVFTTCNRLYNKMTCLISEYNDMKDKLVEYLKQFDEENKVVEAKDIHKFFSNLKDSKRRRLNDDFAPPDFCR